MTHGGPAHGAGHDGVFGDVDPPAEPHTTVRRIEKVSDLLEVAGRLKASTVAIPGGHRVEDLRLVESARDHGIVDRIVLIGDMSATRSAIEQVGIDIEEEDIRHGENDTDIARRTVELVRDGAVDIVLKGGISTPVLNRHMLQIAVRPTVSLATLFDSDPIAGGKPLILTDAGFTTVCNFGRLVHIIENAVELAHVVIGLDKPRVAVLSANEKEIPSLPSTSLGKSLSERPWRDAVVYGPLSFDLAVDPESVEVKGLPDRENALEVAGQADILVCPGIDSANILYKAITSMTKFGQASLAGITIGFSAPYIILSRADTVDTKLYSVALCSAYAQLSHRARGQTSPAAASQTEARSGGHGKDRGEPAVLAVLSAAGSRLDSGLFQGDRWIERETRWIVPEEKEPAEDEEGLPKAAGNTPIEAVVWGPPAGAGRVSQPERAVDASRERAEDLARRLNVPLIAVSPETGLCRDLDQRLVLRAARLAAGQIGRDIGELALIVVVFDEDVSIALIVRGEIVDAARLADFSPGGLGKGGSQDPTGGRVFAVAGEVGRLFGAWGVDLDGIAVGGDFMEHRETVADLRKKLGRIAPVYTVEGSGRLDLIAREGYDLLLGGRTKGTGKEGRG